MCLLRLFRKKKGKDVRKIYKTTDGYFTGTDKNKKPRRVAVVDQRKDDGALAVVKIFSKNGKDGNMYIDDFTLYSKEHPSLTEDSVVGHRIYYATKNGKREYKAIYTRDLKDERDSLTKKEHRTIIKKAGGKVKKHRRTDKKIRKRWKRHFKDK